MHIIIFSRLASKRFKNKAKIILGNNKTLIEHTIDQAQKILPKRKIILATTKNKEDNYLCNIAKKKNINFFRGSENNVLKRTIDCCKKYNIKYFLRYCGDRPIIDILKIKKIIKNFKKFEQYDLISTNNQKEKIDQGLTIEIINSEILVKIPKTKSYRKNNEHITNYLYKNYENFKTYKIPFLKLFKKQYKYTIDYKKDLKVVNYLIKNYKESKIKDIVKLYENAKKKHH